MTERLEVLAVEYVQVVEAAGSAVRVPVLGPAWFVMPYAPTVPCVYFSGSSVETTGPPVIVWDAASSKSRRPVCRPALLLYEAR